MRCIARYILGAILLIPAISSQAATLPSNYALSFTSAAGSSVSGHGGGGAFYFDAASLDSLNGIVLGTAQPTVPDIDQTWASAQLFIPGNHYTSSPVTVLSSSTLDFSGWVMRINPTSPSYEDYAFGSMQGIATYSFDGTNFVLDYSWSAAVNNGGTFIGSLGVTDYQLHLVGTAAPAVPLPGAAWLFGSGLLGLIGFARCKTRSV